LSCGHEDKTVWYFRNAAWRDQSAGKFNLGLLGMLTLAGRDMVCGKKLIGASGHLRQLGPSARD
jgi:hypothetical protein